MGVLPVTEAGRLLTGSGNKRPPFPKRSSKWQLGVPLSSPPALASSQLCTPWACPGPTA